MRTESHWVRVTSGKTVPKWVTFWGEGQGQDFNIQNMLLFSRLSCPTLRSHGRQHARFPCPSPNSIIKWKKVKLLSYVLLCEPKDYSISGSSVHGIFQARLLEWVAIFFSRGSSWPRDRTWVSLIVGRPFTIWHCCMLFSSCRATASHCGGFSRRAQASVVAARVQ